MRIVKLLCLVVSVYSASPLFAQVPTTSLVGYYPFNGNANDVSGNANHGNIVGTLTLTPDRFGNNNAAYLFNGQPNYIYLPPASFTVNNAYTYSYWYFHPTGSLGDRFHFSMGNTFCQCSALQPANSLFAGSYNGASNQSYAQYGPNVFGRWNHVVVTRDNTAIKMYLNGVQVGNPATGIIANLPPYYGAATNSVIIGCRSNLNPNNYMNGMLDDIRFYGAALSPTDAVSLYNEGCYQVNPTVSYTACTNNSLALSAIPVSTNTINWYDSPTATISIATGTALATQTFSTPGTYTYYVSPGNCEAFLRTAITITVLPQPLISATSGSICSGNTFTINATGATNYTFSGGSNVVSPGTTTSYTVTGDNGIGCKAANAAISTVSVVPSPTINVNSGFICAGENFTITPSGASAYTIIPGGTFTVSPAVNTTYSVTGTNGNGCYGNAISNVAVVPNPMISVTGNTNICLGSSTNLQAGGGVVYTWSSGQSGSLVTVSPTVTTTYTVTGVNIFACSGTAVITVSVNPHPTITVNSGSICAGKPFTITPSGASGYTFSGGSAVVTPTSTSSYTVTGSSGPGCVSQPVISTVTVVPLPALSVNSGSICIGNSFTLSPSGALSYTFPGGSSIVSPSVTTNYNIVGIAATGCTNTVTSTVTVIPLPVISVSGPPAICYGNSATLTASGANGYFWSTGANTATTVVSPTVTTLYGVSGTNAFGCMNSTVFVLNVNTQPTITVNSGTVCAGKPFTILPTGAGTYSYAPSGPVVSPTTSSSYTVTGFSGQGCASQPVVSNVSVTPLPNIIVSGGAICVGGSFSLNPSGATSYTYSGGSQVVSPTTSTSYTITGGGSGGCTNTAVATVTVNALPVIAISGPTAICNGATATLTASGALTYTWSTGSNANTTAVSPSVTTVYTVTGSNASNCVRTATRTVIVNSNPTIVVSSGSICQGKPYTIVATGASSYSYVPSGPAVSPATNSSYTVIGFNGQGCASQPVVSSVSVTPLPNISVSGGAICVGETFTLSPSGAATYTYSGGSQIVSPAVTTSYTITGAGLGGCTNTAVATVTVNALPVIAISGPTAICNGATATLTATGATGYSWSTGSNANTAVVSPSVTTTYTVTGSNANNCVRTATRTLIVNANPNIAVTSGSICQGKSFTIVATGATTYSYAPSGPVVSPATNSSYTVTGFSTQGCASQPVVSNVSVTPLPNISVSSGAICVGESFTLNPTGAASYTYSGGSQVVSPAVTTNYTITGTGPGGCTNTTVATVTVNSLPVIAITGPTAICNGANATLTVSGAVGYTWSTGSNTNTTVITPSLTTTYTVTGANANNCLRTATRTVVVNASPTIAVSSGSICQGKPYTIVATGAGSYSFVPSGPIVSPTTNASYTVTGFSAQGCASQPVVSNVSVTLLPNVTVSSGAICAGDSFTLNPSGASGYTYSGGSQVVSPAATTSYTITGAGPGGCTNTAVATVTVNALPVVAITGSASVCNGATATLTATGATGYTWSTGANANTVAVSPSVTTIYTVTGANVNNCTNTATRTVTVNAIPIIAVSSGTICQGKSFTIVATGANTYSYVPAGPLVNPSSNSSYTVTGFSAQGCASQPVVSSVSVTPLPNITVSGGAICAGGSFTLNPSGASGYTYSGGSQIVSPATTNSYTITGAGLGGCTNTAVATVTVNALPVISISGPTAICNGASATLTASGAAGYTWSAGANTNTLAVSPSVTTIYTISGSNANNCVNASTGTVVVNAIPVIAVSSGSVCQGNSYTIVPTGAITFSFAPSGPVVNPSTNSSYTVTGFSAQGCASQPVVSNVSVASLPAITVSSITICDGMQHTLTPSGGVSYTYSGGSAIVTPSVTTNYTVIGMGTNGCTNNAVATVSVNPNPTVSVAGPTNICAGTPVTYTASGGSAYSWFPGPLNGTVVTLTPSTTSTYTVAALTVTSGCIGYYTLNINVTQSPTIAVSSGSICPGDSYIIQATGASSYIVSGGTATVSPAFTTQYTVTGTNGSGCVSQPVTATVFVLPSPVVSVNSGSICAGESFTILPTGAATYSYLNGSQVVMPVNTSTYDVIGFSADGCVSGNTAVSTVFVYPQATLVTAGPTQLCAGETATITVSGASSYTWDSGANGNSITVTPTANTIYTVDALDANGCLSQEFHSITVNPLPTITVNSGVVCGGASFTITPNGAITYSFSSGSNAVTPSITTVYTVTGSDANGCVSEPVLSTVTVVNSITVNITGNSSACAGDTVKLVASGANTYSWNTGATGTLLTLTGASGGTYSVTGTNGTCSDDASVVVTIHPLPVLELNAERDSICAGENVKISATGGNSYKWSTGETGNSIVFKSAVSSVITVTGTSANGCKSGQSITIVVSECTALSEQIETSIRIFPNPSNDVLNICGSPAGALIVIEDLQGRRMHAQQITETCETIPVKPAGLVPGVYAVRVLVNGRQNTVRMVTITD